jgi:hypothetical protein
MHNHMVSPPAIDPAAGGTAPRTARRLVLGAIAGPTLFITPSLASARG